MKLYRIRNKSTGEFLYWKINPRHQGHWGPSGSFWKRIDTVKKHIDHLMHDWNIKTHSAGIISIWERGQYLKEREGVFEVVVSDVTVNGEETIPAEKLIEMEAL